MGGHSLILVWMDPHIHGILINFLNVDSLISYILPENLLSFVFNNLFSRRLLIYTKGHIQGYKLKNSYFSFHSLWKKKKKKPKKGNNLFPLFIFSFLHPKIHRGRYFLFPFLSLSTPLVFSFLISFPRRHSPISFTCKNLCLF